MRMSILTGLIECSGALHKNWFLSVDYKDVTLQLTMNVTVKCKSEIKGFVKTTPVNIMNKDVS